MLRKTKPHKQLLVSLADENYIEYVKQLFSSAYWNGGWKGDYMLLAYKVPEEKLKWFTDKGILVKRCEEIKTPILESSNFSEVVLNKFIIFKEEFKKWDNVLFLDVDIIIRYNINKLGKVKGFNAVKEKFPLNPIKDPIGEMTPKRQKIFDEIIERYGIDSVASFNSGVMAFSTDIITPTTFKEIVELSDRYHEAINFSEQPILSIYFNKKLKRLPRYYNYSVSLKEDSNSVDKYYKNNVTILHFIFKDKPWIQNNTHNFEWNQNLINFDLIINVSNYNKAETCNPTIYLMNFVYFIYYFSKNIDIQIGLVGIKLRKLFKI